GAPDLPPPPLRPGMSDFSERAAAIVDATIGHGYSEVDARENSFRARRHNWLERYPQCRRRLPMLAVRVHGGASVLLRQADQRHDLVLHLRAARHWLVHRPFSDPADECPGGTPLPRWPLRLHGRVAVAHISGIARGPSVLSGKMDHGTDLARLRRLVRPGLAVRSVDAERP